jgi:hypothetical protein
VIATTLDSITRIVVVAALAYAANVALTHWAVRRHTIGPLAWRSCAASATRSSCPSSIR